MAENDAGECCHWLGFSLALEAELCCSQAARASLPSRAHLCTRHANPLPPTLVGTRERLYICSHEKLLIKMPIR